ncbi:MAG: hypothetical protein GX442_14350 [Candidatus Riflebacteria bacterium]|nr:hypothetical protein [Candidatus Riflebacteria bacterium]
MKQAFENTNKSKVLVDGMTTVCKFPARRVIWMGTQKAIVGMVQILANGNLYMLVAAKHPGDLTSFQPEFDRLVGGFTLKGEFGTDF